MQKNAILLCAAVLVQAGCASSARTEFDPAGDPRIGAEVQRACFSSTAASNGGYREVGGRDAFVIGSLRKKYLLVFSGGCGDIGFGGSFPVFKSYGDDCRRRGEIVQTANGTIGVTGACSIQHIYEWDEDAVDDVEAEPDV
jgi:hypothetical protein